LPYRFYDIKWVGNNHCNQARNEASQKLEVNQMSYNFSPTTSENWQETTKNKNRPQSNLRGSCQSIFSLCRHHPNHWSNQGLPAQDNSDARQKLCRLFAFAGTEQSALKKLPARVDTNLDRKQTLLAHQPLQEERYLLP